MPSVVRSSAIPLDAEALDRLQRTFGDPAELRAFLQEFLSSSTPLLHAMQAKHEARGRSVELAAHTLKSMARLVGALELAESCRVVEFAAHGARSKAVPARLIAQVALHLRSSQEAVKRLIG